MAEALHGVFVVGFAICVAALASAFLVPAGRAQDLARARAARRADARGRIESMAGDAPLLERLAKLPAVPAAAAVELLERLSQPQADPVIGPLFGVDEEGDAAVNPLVPAVLKQFGDRTELTCYAALIEGLTGDLERRRSRGRRDAAARLGAPARRPAAAAAGALADPRLHGREARVGA